MYCGNCLDDSGRVLLADFPGIQFIGFMLAIILGLAAAFFQFTVLQQCTLFYWSLSRSIGYRLCVSNFDGFGRGEWAGVGLGTVFKKWLIFLKHIEALCWPFGVKSLAFWHRNCFSIVFYHAGLLYQNWCKWCLCNIVSTCRLFGLWHWYYFLAANFGKYLGMNMGVLPTKGLTLPLISYGDFPL